MNVGENIKRLRLQCDMTQKKLAELVGVEQSMICQIERGTKIPTILLAQSIADAMDCSIVEFLS